MPSHLNDILLGTGLLSSGYWLLGNLACSLIGVVPAVLADDHAASLSPVQRVKLWQWFYDKAKIHFVSTIFLTSLSFGCLAFLRSTPPSARRYLVASSATFASILPYTALAMLPLNNELAGMVEKGGRDEKALGESDVRGKLGRWEILNGVRMGLGGLGFGLGVFGAGIGWGRRG